MTNPPDSRIKRRLAWAVEEFGWFILPLAGRWDDGLFFRTRNRLSLRILRWGERRLRDEWRHDQWSESTAPASLTVTYPNLSSTDFWSGGRYLP